MYGILRTCQVAALLFLKVMVGTEPLPSKKRGRCLCGGFLAAVWDHSIERKYEKVRKEKCKEEVKEGS